MRAKPARGGMANFSRVARLYRAAEYLAFGPMLERCRYCFLPEMTSSRKALVLGDGDGRFTSELLRADSAVRVQAVDASLEMLRLLSARAERAGMPDRVTALYGDARGLELAESGFDLVATHFFLDCLTEGEVEEVVARVQPHLAPGALWVVSEFEVPRGGVKTAVSRMVIAGLYAAFRVLTGLRVREIPPWRGILKRAGMERRAERSFLGGLLVAELWQVGQPVALEVESH